MLLSKKHLEDVKKQKESDAKKKSFKDREKKRKKEHVEKINTSPPPPPQPPFIEFEYRGPKSPNWMNEAPGQSKYAPYFSATFLGASLESIRARRETVNERGAFIRRRSSLGRQFECIHRFGTKLGAKGSKFTPIEKTTSSPL